MAILENLLRRIRPYREPIEEGVLIDEYGIVVDAEVDGMRLRYTHEPDPERGVLRVFRIGNREDLAVEFFDSHIRGSRKQRKKGKEWTRVLEAVVYHHEDGTQEKFRKPQGETFEYEDRRGNILNEKTHDPVVGAVIEQAKKRYEAASQWYAQLLNSVQAEARKKVSQ